MAAPRILLIEPSSRCNLACSMCPRQTPGCIIDEADLSPATLEPLAAWLPGVERVAMAGLGEPLLNPELVSLVAFLRRHLAPGARIGLQTNCLLLTAALARALVAAGLDEVCLSVDALETTPGAGADTTLHGGGFLPSIERAFSLFRQARDTLGRRLDLGVECVLMRSNRRALPSLIDWAAGQRASFVLVSHLLPPDARWTMESLANPNAASAVALYREFEEKAELAGMRLQDAPKALWKFHLSRTAEERALAALMKEIMEEARRRNIHLHMDALFQWANDIARQELPALFAQAVGKAASHGLRLHLPTLAALDTRDCPFITRRILCIDAKGKFSPCHYLWHTHTTAEQGRPKHVAACVLGTLDSTIATLQHEEIIPPLSDTTLPRCYDCSASPCSELVAATYGQPCDCFSNTMPCGHCPWPLGLVSCLGTEPCEATGA